MIPTTASEKHLRWIAGSPLIRGYPQAFGQTIWQADRRSWVFPTANAIAKASLRDLRTCGLSHRKAEHVKDFARCVANGDLALEALKYQTDVEVSDRLMRCRGFGAWSAQYFLLRRLGRLDSLPADDIGLRRTVGSYLARRRRLTPRQLERALAPSGALLLFIWRSTHVFSDIRVSRRRGNEPESRMIRKSPLPRLGIDRGYGRRLGSRLSRTKPPSTCRSRNTAVRSVRGTVLSRSTLAFRRATKDHFPTDIVALIIEPAEVRAGCLK
jgi:hypothetical protein